VQVLIIGAGGFLGSGVSRRVAAAGHNVLALARTPEKAAQFDQLGYGSVIGDFAGSALLDAADRADAVINCASIPFDQEWPSVAPILDRLRGSQKPFVQTTGTAVLSIETPNGEWREETFAEDDPFTPPPWIAVRTETEARVRAAAAEGVRAMVVRPPMIWGHGGSAQIPAIIDSVRTTGAACYVGSGLNLYSHVHVDDLGDLYRLTLEVGAPGALYHSVAGEICWRSVAEAVGQAHGRAARSVTLEDAKRIWGDFRGPLFFGVSSRSRSPRSRTELGWTPKHVDVLTDVLSGSYRPANDAD